MRFLQLILVLIVVVGCSGCDEKTVVTTPVGGVSPDFGLSVSLSAGTPPARQLVMGTRGNTVLAFKIEADSLEDRIVSSIKVYDEIDSGVVGKPSFQNFTLWNDGFEVAGPVNMELTDAFGRFTFLLSTPILIPRGTSQIFEIAADVASFSSGGAVSGSEHRFQIDGLGIVANSANNTSQYVEVRGSAVGNPMSVYRTKLTVSVSILGASTNRSRVVTDDAIRLYFEVGPEGPAALKAVNVAMNGPALTGVSILTGICVDPNSAQPLGTSAPETVQVSGSACSFTFSPDFAFEAGTNKEAKLRFPSSNFGNSTLGPDGLTVVVTARFSDGTTHSIPAEVEPNSTFVSYD